jgi:hypothetical protein
MNLDLKTKDGDRVCLSNHDDGLWLSVWLFRGHASVPITLKDAAMLRDALNVFLEDADHE